MNNDITTISLRSSVAKELREMFRKYGGRRTFGSLNNFVKILITIGSFYTPAQLLVVKYAIEVSKEMKGSEMARILLSALEREVEPADTGIVDVRDMARAINPDDLPPVEVETPDEEYIEDDEEEKDLL